MITVGGNLNLDEMRAKALKAQEATRHVFANRPPPFPYRVPRMLRHLAKEIAGQFYDGHQRHSAPPLDFRKELVHMDVMADRSKEFRTMFPNQRLYVLWMWPYFVKLAREWQVAMLGMPHISEHMKERIYECHLADYDGPAFEPDNVATLIASAVHEQQSKQSVKRR